MISHWVRTWYGKVLNPFLEILVWLGISANMVTIASMLTMILAGILLALGQLLLGACVLILAGFLDGIDGALARMSRVRSPFGAFLDSICDHCGDFAVYLGLLILCIHAQAGLDIILIFVAMFSSVFGSHVRSRAGMLGIDIKTIGFFTRFERVFLLFICLLIRRIDIALWGLAVFNSLSAMQRVIYTIRAYQTSRTVVQNPETL